MKDKEKQVRHIRAARDWLGEAEASVQADEGVRGGLKLMLAEAELVRMRETKPGRMRRFFGRGAPLIAACLIAAGAALFYRVGMPAEQAEIPAASEVAREEAPKEARPLPNAPLDAAPHSEVGVAAERAAAETTQKKRREVVPKEPVQESAAAPSRVETTQRSAAPVQQQGPAAKVPDAEVQKLMQDAGKALREK